MTPKTQLVHIRMPKHLHTVLMREAKREGLTLNAVILNRIGGAMALIDNVMGQTTAILRDEVTAAVQKAFAENVQKAFTEKMAKQADEIAKEFVAKYVKSKINRDDLIDAELKDVKAHIAKLEDDIGGDKRR